MVTSNAHRKQDGPPLPSPLLPPRDEREEIPLMSSTPLPNSTAVVLAPLAWKLAPLLSILALSSQLQNLEAESLWREGRARSMVGDKRAAAVGDILNIVVQEN